MYQGDLLETLNFSTPFDSHLHLILVKLNKVEMLPPGVHSLHDLLKHHWKLQGPKFLVMGWTVHTDTTAALIHTWHYETFAVTESKPATDTTKNFWEDQKKNITRKGEKGINSAASFGTWYAKGSRGITWEKCTEDILCIAVHYQISTFYIMFQPSFRLCLVIHVIRRELITAIFSDYLKMKKPLLQYF